ncbi:hypothetical protein [Sinosporangium siamense]|nr:hypothetical protein [Sinosporangium siamense]
MELEVVVGVRKVATVVVGRRSRIFIVSMLPLKAGFHFTKPGDYRRVRHLIVSALQR